MISIDCQIGKVVALLLRWEIGGFTAGETATTAVGGNAGTLGGFAAIVGVKGPAANSLCLRMGLRARD